jgi:hypothetical protein
MDAVPVETKLVVVEMLASLSNRLDIGLLD